jgi:hypothetical protein
MRTWTWGLLSGLSALFAGCEPRESAPVSEPTAPSATHPASSAAPTAAVETATFALG